ncbi:hypothetical protein wCauA_04035 [Wolbachia endosymbiont of Carposina sasakii]|nr:hypothetical protein wCauA_04035 [Wolbachia endosymbiont of Carposina sasakii]
MSSQCPNIGIQHFTQSHQERCILHNTFMLTNLIKFLDPSGLCCIATYERLTIIRIISNLLKILFFLQSI